MHTIEQVLDLDRMRTEIDELQEQVSSPDLWDDQANAQRVTGRLSVLQADMERVGELRGRLEDLEALRQLGEEEGDEDSLAEAEVELVRGQQPVRQPEGRPAAAGGGGGRGRPGRGRGRDGARAEAGGPARGAHAAVRGVRPARGARVGAL